MENQAFVNGMFAKYLNNQCTSEEITLLFKYFNNPANETILRSLIHTELEQINTEQDHTYNEDVVTNRVRANLIEAINKNASISKAKFEIPRWIQIAAFWFILLGAGALIINHYLDEIKRIFNPVTNITLTSKAGERKYTVLADGSKIWLSPSSSLSYPDQFNGNLREVKLEGEAFFQIAKDKKHPFIIHSGQMSTRVVGTSFEIDAYKAQKDFKVTVLTGIVKVSLPAIKEHNSQEVVLKPFQRSVYIRAEAKLTSLSYPQANQSLSKKTGVINSRNMSLNELVNELSNYYSTPIQLTAIPENSVCYGDFDTNKPLLILLKQIAAAVNAEVIWSDDKYILRGEGRKE